MAQPLQGLLKQEVTRRQFLGLLGLAVGSLFGMERIITLLTGKSLTSSVRQHSLVNGATTSYGGVKATSLKR